MTFLLSRLPQKSTRPLRLTSLHTKNVCRLWWLWPGNWRRRTTTTSSAARKDNVIRLWEYLLELLRARRQRLEMNLGLQKIFQEMLYIMDWMDEMKVKDMPAYSLELIQSGLSLFWAPPTNPQHTVMPLV